MAYLTALILVSIILTIFGLWHNSSERRLYKDQIRGKEHDAK